MITLYLVRHAQPDTGAGRKSVCLGQLDIPLSQEGEEQAVRLAAYFRKKRLDAVYTSPLVRCVRTAQILAEESGHHLLPVQTVSEFAEVDTGEWDGMDFDRIRKCFPAEYEARGRHPGRYVIPGGESLEEAGARFLTGLKRVLAEESLRFRSMENPRETNPDTNLDTNPDSNPDSNPETNPDRNPDSEDRGILIVGHAGVFKALLCHLTGRDIDELHSFQLPYASLTVLRLGEESADLTSEAADRLGGARILSAGLRPVSSISRSEVERLWELCGVDAPLRAHMEAVADLSMGLIGCESSIAGGPSIGCEPSIGGEPSSVPADLPEEYYRFKGTVINPRLLFFAALLHDIKRAEGGGVHPEAGADFLRREGYQEIADVMRLHHDPEVYRPGEPLNEAEILYYADKRVQGSSPVTLSERFETSRQKCRTPEALGNHERRYQAALGIEKKLIRCGQKCDMIL